MNTTQKGFTLIELLVVIAIVAVLSVVVILTLNPAELLKQARDSNRISDLNTIKSAISLYLADGQTTISPSYTTCYMTVAPSTTQCTIGGAISFGAAYVTATPGSSTAVTGSGWVPINFDLITTRSPLSKLPLDPINNATYAYAYAATTTNTAFKLVSNMESTKYAQGGGSDVESTDGGNVSSTYEVGTNLAL
jgi:prepilin-type N-terminal cleavage/methylation domain-containing protein